MDGFMAVIWLFLLSFLSLPPSIEAVSSPPIQHFRIVNLKPQPPGEGLVQDADYNEGAYGRYVTQTFRSANVTVPRLNMDMPFSNCDDGSYLFVTPRGEIVMHPLAAIYDST